MWQRLLGNKLGFYQETISKNLIEKGYQIVLFERTNAPEEIDKILEVLKTVAAKGSQNPPHYVLYESEVEIKNIDEFIRAERPSICTEQILLNYRHTAENTLSLIYRIFDPKSLTNEELENHLITITKTSDQKLEIRYPEHVSALDCVTRMRYNIITDKSHFFLPKENLESFNSKIPCIFYRVNEVAQGIYKQIINTPLKLQLFTRSCVKETQNLEIELLEHVGWGYQGEDPTNDAWQIYEYVNGDFKSPLAKRINSANFGALLKYEAASDMNTTKNARTKE